MLANKISLSARVDALGEAGDGGAKDEGEEEIPIGQRCLEQVEKRQMQLDGIAPPTAAAKKGEKEKKVGKADLEKAPIYAFALSPFYYSHNLCYVLF